ncbi:hypothetical protein [Siminovitchia sp. FSL W7-1587]|uniref:hypothetical protein n=1 Tax=Siminovitchia sp. FSL W7-1587 TaxID=2954699 RepID=UPI0030D09556
MTTGFILLISVFFTCFFGVAVCAFFARKKVTVMQGMIFAMSMAMGMGLFAGTLLGIVFQGHLLLSTAVGMGAGALAGALIGSSFSFLALLEGMLSGVMAGMMGAMLGEMIEPADWDKALMLMFTFALLICFLLAYEILPLLKEQFKWMRYYQNPFLLCFLFFLLCLFLYTQTPFIQKVILPYHFH